MLPQCCQHTLFMLRGKRVMAAVQTTGEARMIKGSCCCKAVQFEVASAPSFVGTCHCSRCRKVGASTIAFVKREDLTWISGKDSVHVFKATAPYIYDRCFCDICGTSLGEILSDEDSFPIAANAFDDDIGVMNQGHEFVGEKPAWYTICDDAPQSHGHPEKT